MSTTVAIFTVFTNVSILEVASYDQQVGAGDLSYPGSHSPW